MQVEQTELFAQAAAIVEGAIAAASTPTDHAVFHGVVAKRGISLDPAEWVAHLKLVEAGFPRDYERFPFVVIDLFAGAGGSSNGVMRALASLRVPTLLVQINHWSTAIATQILNFPNAFHYNASVETPSPAEVIPWLHVDLLVASPECISYSQARGKNKKIREQSRSSAAYLLTWLSDVNVVRFAFENVKEWKSTWGRMNKKGTATLRGYEGEYYRIFFKRLKELGYPRAIDGLLNAADYGSATCRIRLFVCAKKGQPAHLPQPTHTKFPQKYPDRLPWRTARQIIDFTDRGDSSFCRYDKKGKALGPHAVNSLKRTRAGYERQVTERPGAAAYVAAFDRYIDIAREYSKSTPPTDKGLAGASLSRSNAWRARYDLPERDDTLEKRARERTTILLKASDEWRTRYHLSGEGILTAKERAAITRINVERARAATKEAFREPLMDFTWAELLSGRTDTVDMLPSPVIAGQHGGSNGRSVDDGPMMTVTGDGAIGLGTPSLAEPTLIRANAGETSTYDDTTRPVSLPTGTITPTQSMALASPHLSCMAHGEGDLRDVKMEQPFPSSTSKRNLAVNTPIAENILIEVAHGTHPNKERRPADLDEPFGTLHAGGGKYAAGSPDIQLAVPGLSSMYGGFERGEIASIVSLDAPAPSVSAQGQHLAIYHPQIAEAGLVSKHYTFNDNPDLDKPLPTNDTAGGGYVTIPDIAEASIVSHGSDNGRGLRAHSTDNPIPATTGGRGTGYLANPQIIPQHFNAPTHDCDQPIPTPVAISRIGLTQSSDPQPLPESVAPEPFIYEPFGERDTQAERVHSLDKPALTVTPRGAGTLVQSASTIRDVEYKPKIRIDGVVYVIDSTFRMLRNRELAKAMDLIVDERGFDYVFFGTATDVTKQIGNAVASNVMEAITRELCKDVVGLPGDVEMFDVMIAPLPRPAANDLFGIYKERVRRVHTQKSKAPLPTWFDAKENATHVAIHSPDGTATIIELERNDAARAAYHPYEIAIVENNDEPTAIGLFDVAEDDEATIAA